MNPDTPKMPFQATRTALAGKFVDIDGVMPGSIVMRQMHCGKRNCACKADPSVLHGPYIQWTRIVAGKTVTRYLNAEQLARHQRWFDNAHRIKDLVAKLETASVQALAEVEGRPRFADPIVIRHVRRHYFPGLVRITGYKPNPGASLQKSRTHLISRARPWNDNSNL